MQQETIQFHDDELLVVRDDQGQGWVAIRPICGALGIDHGSQWMRLDRDPKFNRCDITTVGADGKQREMSCIPVSQLNGWLFSINANKVRPGSRDKLLLYQKECFEVLFRHFMPHGGNPEELQRMNSILLDNNAQLTRAHTTLVGVIDRMTNHLGMAMPGLDESATAAGKALAAQKKIRHLRRVK